VKVAFVSSRWHLTYINRALALKRQPSWPLASMLPIAAISLAGQVQSRSSSRVPPPGSSTAAVGLRSQTALTGSDRPWTIPQREHGHPAAELPVTAVCHRRPGSLRFSRQSTGAGAAGAGASAGAEASAPSRGASGPAGRLEDVQKVLTRDESSSWTVPGRCRVALAPAASWSPPRRSRSA
jgi:hypothetical protein